MPLPPIVELGVGKPPPCRGKKKIPATALGHQMVTVVALGPQLILVLPSLSLVSSWLILLLHTGL